MRELSEQKNPPSIDFFDPLSIIRSLPRSCQIAANSNRPDMISDHSFGSDPKAVAEAEKLAVEALYLGADILEMLQRINAKMSAELSEETAKLAKTLMFWGVGAASVVRERAPDPKA